MKKQIAALLIALSITVPVFAQDVTPEPIGEPTVISIETPVPTAEPVPAPSPVDTAKIPEALWTVIIVLVVGIVGVAFVGIVSAARGLPEWAKALLVTGAKSGVDSLDKYAKSTESPLDDLAVAELRKKVAELEAALVATQQQVMALKA